MYALISEWRNAHAPLHRKGTSMEGKMRIVEEKRGAVEERAGG